MIILIYAGEKLDYVGVVECAEGVDFVDNVFHLLGVGKDPDLL
jgi:hypothetical protein